MEVKFESLWLKIPLIFYSVGFFVHNVFLSSYSIFEFDILQSKYIYVGLMSVTFIFGICLLFSIRFDFVDPSKNLKLLNIFGSFVQCQIFSLLLFTILKQPDLKTILFQAIPETNLVVPTSGKYENWIKYYFFLIYFSSMLLVLEFGFIFFKKEKAKKILDIILLVVGIPTIFVTGFLLEKVPDFKDEFSFVLIIWLFSMGAWIGFSRGYKAGVKTFIDGISELPFHKKFDTTYGSVFFSFLSFVFLLLILENYAVCVYPKISSNLGGAAPVPAEIIIAKEKSVLNGKIISENDRWIAIMDDKDNSIKRIKIEDVSEINLKK